MTTTTLGTITTNDLVDWLGLFDQELNARKDWLTELDSAIGDADHGINMARGFHILADRLSPDLTDAGEVFKIAGNGAVSLVGGASGVLYGTLFLDMAREAGTHPVLNLSAFAATFQAGVSGVVRRGGADPGDKTMIDVLLPTASSLTAAVASKASVTEAFQMAAKAAVSGRDSTEPLVARKGRASYLGDRSAHHIDPGAASAALLVQALADSWVRRHP